MSGPKTSSADGSTAVGGDVNAPIVNVNTGADSLVNVTVDQHIARELPSFLGAVIVTFSKQSLSEYGLGARRSLPVEVIEKIKYNDLSPEHRALVDYRRHSLVLEKAYLGVEQQNADARYLVRRKAAIEYESQLQVACKQESISAAKRINYVKANANGIVENVINSLLEDYRASRDPKVEQEMAHLAISLIVADAVIECEVLERPADVAPA
jgi:hypothetical protein